MTLRDDYMAAVEARRVASVAVGMALVAPDTTPEQMFVLDAEQQVAIDHEEQLRRIVPKRLQP